jgi:hypothetical protein
VFSYGRQLGELAHADGELAEMGKLQQDVREMESNEWSQPLLTAAGDGDEGSNPDRMNP